jgi:hypothetical protein
MCGATFCVVSVTGASVSCANLSADTASGLRFGAVRPEVDTASGDIVTTLQFVVQ